MAKLLIPMIQSIDHTLYAEAFIGMGGIFLRRTHRPKVEAINDINRDVWTLFMILREHFQQFLDVLKWQITSREEFERLLKLDPDALTDLQRAARFLYLQRMMFGGSRTTPARFDLLKLVPMREDAHERGEFLISDRLSFMRFLGLGLSDRVPDARTLWLFWEKLSKTGAIQALFDRFDAALRASGSIAMGGQIVDASLIAAPKQRNAEDEKNALPAIKEGRILEESISRSRPSATRTTSRLTRPDPQMAGERCCSL